MPDSASQVTHLLEAWRKGDQTALQKLMPLVYDELRRIARQHMGRERSGHTLQTTALVNEAYLKVAKHQEIEWNDRIHFFAIAAQMMRQLLVDHARRRKRDKRGGDVSLLSLNEEQAVSPEQGIDVLALHFALERLATMDPRKAQIVELRYFGGLNIEETAEALGIAPVTVKREWSRAKAWLFGELKAGEEGNGP
jgi:RNA polymerase sigma factor (TIGR02999 family)